MVLSTCHIERGAPVLCDRVDTDVCCIAVHVVRRDCNDIKAIMIMLQQVVDCWCCHLIFRSALLCSAGGVFNSVWHYL